MFARFFNSVLNIFVVLFQVIKMFFVWIFEHTWAFIVAIFLPLINLFNAIVDAVSGWFTKLDNIFDSPYEFSSIFDYLDYMLQNCLGDDLLSMIGKDCIYVFNLGGLFSSVFTIVVPLLLAGITYKVIKSWIPTVSGA